MSKIEHPNSHLFKKRDVNAIKRQERLMANADKWKKEREKMQKMQEDFLKGRR